MPKLDGKRQTDLINLFSKTTASAFKCFVIGSIVLVVSCAAVPKDKPGQVEVSSRAKSEEAMSLAEKQRLIEELKNRLKLVPIPVKFEKCRWIDGNEIPFLGSCHIYRLRAEALELPGDRNAPDTRLEESRPTLHLVSWPSFPSTTQERPLLSAMP